MKNFLQIFICSLALDSCVSKPTTYEAVEEQLGKPNFAGGSEHDESMNALIKKEYEKEGDPGFTNLRSSKCIYVKDGSAETTCSSYKLHENQSLMIRCISKTETDSKISLRGTCVKEVCIDIKMKDCRVDGNAILLK